MGKGGGGMDDRITELLSAGDQEGIALLQKQYGNICLLYTSRCV